LHAPLPPTKIQFNDSWSTIFRSDGCKSSDIFCKEDGNQTTLRERPYCNKWSWWDDVCLCVCVVVVWSVWCATHHTKKQCPSPPFALFDLEQ